MSVGAGKAEQLNFPASSGPSWAWTTRTRARLTCCAKRKLSSLHWKACLRLWESCLARFALFTHEAAITGVDLWKCREESPKSDYWSSSSSLSSRPPNKHPTKCSRLSWQPFNLPLLVAATLVRPAAKMETFDELKSYLWERFCARRIRRENCFKTKSINCCRCSPTSAKLRFYNQFDKSLS